MAIIEVRRIISVGNVGNCRTFAAATTSTEMRIVATILFLLLLQLNGCTIFSVPVEKAERLAEISVLADKVEADLMNLYNAAADNRNALQQEANICLPTTSVQIFAHRNRVINHNVSIRHALLQTHRPTVSKLIHHSVTQLVAFPKEYHVFRLRRILV